LLLNSFQRVNFETSQFDFFSSLSLKLNCSGAILTWTSRPSYSKDNPLNILQSIRTKFGKQLWNWKEKKSWPDSLSNPCLKLNRVKVILTWSSWSGRSKDNSIIIKKKIEKEIEKKMMNWDKIKGERKNIGGWIEKKKQKKRLSSLN